MRAPDMQEHIAFRYLAIGASIIPLGRREKRPHFGLLPGTKWKEYQQRRANAQEVAGWIENGAENWGLICGLVSDRIYCGDVDNIAMARWVLDDPTRAVFRGACIVESGSGKAHIWFRSKTKVLSGVWYLTNRATNHAGDIRGDGQGNAGPSYMVVPPSLHPDGPAYQERTGSFQHLPDVEDGQTFLRAIGDAYLADVPTAGGKYVQSNDRDILVLSDAEKSDTLKMVYGLNLAKKYADTLLVPGNQTIADRHWSGEPSNSEIDWWVIRALILKGLDFQTIERVYACALVGSDTYRNKSRSNHGYGYLKYTFDKVRNRVTNEQRQARTATGSNFKVEHVIRTVLGPRQSVYRIEVSIQDPVDPNVVHTRHFDVTNKELTNEAALSEAAFAQTQWIPQFLAAQRGHNFRSFAQAVADMVEEVKYAPRSATAEGHVADVLDGLLKPMPSRNLPQTPGEVSMMGWRTGDEYYLRFNEVLRRLKGQIHSVDGQMLMQALEMMGTTVNESYKYDNGEVHTITRLTPRQQRGHLQVLPALPPPSA